MVVVVAMPLVVQGNSVGIVWSSTTHIALKLRLEHPFVASVLSMPSSTTHPSTKPFNPHTTGEMPGAIEWAPQPTRVASRHELPRAKQIPREQGREGCLAAQG